MKSYIFIQKKQSRLEQKGWQKGKQAKVEQNNQKQVKQERKTSKKRKRLKARGFGEREEKNPSHVNNFLKRKTKSKKNQNAGGFDAKIKNTCITFEERKGWDTEQCRHKRNSTVSTIPTSVLGMSFILFLIRLFLDNIELKWI